MNPLLRLLLSIALSYGAAATAKPLPVPGVTGTDDRTINDSRTHPWSAIGRLNITTGGYCTATVIGPRRVLTAAHCLWNRRTARWYPPCALHFLAGYRRGEYEVHALAAEIDVGPGFRMKKRSPGTDWAVVTLDRDILDKTGQIDISEQLPGAGTRLVQAGYSRDHRHVLTVDRSCRRTGVVNGGKTLFHNCDATFGDSGSPLLMKSAGGYRLVGIHVAITGRGQKTKGVAVGSRAFSAWIQSNPLDRPPGRTKACAIDAPEADTVAGDQPFVMARQVK